jgi:tetratricopeptide (TPR) repeat protein
MFKTDLEDENIVTEGYSIAEVSKYCMATDLGLECVCSKRSTVVIGTGATTKKEDSTLYYYAKQIDDELLALQSLNANWAPSGPAIEVTMDELITQYQPEVDMFLKQVKPVIQKIAKAVAKGDRHRRNGEPYSAAMEYSNALGLDEQNVRALFGLGLTYLQYKQHDKAQTVFEQLIALDGFASAEFKHLFNQFGIELRKQDMLEQACRYYLRALEVCSTDENLYFNLARAFVQGGRVGEAESALEKCLNINPRHEEGIKFKKYICSLSLT